MMIRSNRHHRREASSGNHVHRSLHSRVARLNTVKPSRTCDRAGGTPEPPKIQRLAMGEGLSVPLRRRGVVRLSTIAERTPVRHSARGMTLAELVIVCVVIAIVAGLTISNTKVTEPMQPDAVRDRLSGMIEYGQHLAIARPDQRFVLVADPNSDAIWLANDSAPQTPLTHPADRRPFRIQMGPQSGGALRAVRLSGTNFGAQNKVAFDGTGALDSLAPVEIELSDDGASYLVSVSPVSGAVSLKRSAVLTTVESVESGGEAAGDDSGGGLLGGLLGGL